MSESVDMVDFKMLKKAGFNYSELDLSGAGWCMCLPRAGGYLPIPYTEQEPEPEEVGLTPTLGSDPVTLEQMQAEILQRQSKPAQAGMDEVDNSV